MAMVLCLLTTLSLRPCFTKQLITRMEKYTYGASSLGNRIND